MDFFQLQIIHELEDLATYDWETIIPKCKSVR